MFFKLRTRILVAFSTIVVLGMVLMVLILNFSTRSGYETFIKRNDIEFSRRIAPVLGKYYETRGNWDHLLSDLEDLVGTHYMPMMRMGKRHGMTIEIPSIILLNSKGRIFFENRQGLYKEQHISRKEILSTAVPIRVDKKIVAYLMSGSMIDPSLNEGEEGYLNRVTTIVISVSLFILMISLFVSSFFSKKITKPITRLRKVAEEIAAGNYDSRVPVEGDDELANLGSSFNKMAQSLEDNDRWRKQIIADSAHELRTPVSLIQGNLEMILEGVYEADEKHIRALYDETLVLSRLIRELQVLSSAESGSMVLHLEELDPVELVNGVFQIYQAGEKKEGIHLLNALPPNLPFIKGDSQKLKQVFGNILANAFHHTPTGGQIEIRGEIKGGNLIIEIEDSGCGIDKGDLERIFERFYRTDSSRNRNYGGSGLGLAISREIIRLHGGQIWAESSSGKGATIVLKLPSVQK